MFSTTRIIAWLTAVHIFMNDTDDVNLSKYLKFAEDTKLCIAVTEEEKV